MTKKETLSKVRRDIRQGDLGKARDRLHGLLVSFPDDLDIRKRLGEVYWSMQMPQMAGRYWYLIKDKDERMLDACHRFEREMKSNPDRMMFAMKFRGNIDTIKNHFSRETLQRLHQAAMNEGRVYHYWYQRKLKKKEPRVEDDGKSKRGSNIFQWSLLTVLGLGLIFSCIGLITVIKWIF